MRRTTLVVVAAVVGVLRCGGIPPVGARLVGLETASLGALHPVFRDRFERVIARMEAQGYRPRVAATWRDAARQLAYLRSGHTQVRYSFHNATAVDGTREALAADVRPTTCATDAERAAFYRALLAAARAEGLTTGATWTRSGVWHRAYPDIGWDPGHVQVDGVSTTRARLGWRPR